MTIHYTIARHTDRQNVARGHRAWNLLDPVRRCSCTSGARTSQRISQSGNHSLRSQAGGPSESSPRHHSGRTSAALPLDIQATAFQRRVWQELKAIPRGATKSYSKIAADIGHPKAARAVARACATNPVAVAIPCHRVVREDGAMGGYRWGVDRKKKLLALEAG